MKTPAFRIVLLWTGLVLLGPGGEALSDESVPSLEQRLEAALVEQDTPGASVAVVSDGDVVYSAALGVADRTLGTRVETETRFAIGSMGKQFTSTALMMLIDEGALTVEDPIRKYLPDVPDKYGSVTVHQLLTHASGIPRDFKRGHSFKGKKLYKAMAKSKPDFEPGTRFAYSNTNFILLGAIIESISGQSMESFLQSRVFDPLKMSRTICITPDKPVDDRATGYDSVDGEGMNFLPVRFGAGNLLSTAEDLARWDLGLSSASVLPLESQQRMWKPELPVGKFKDQQGFDTSVGYGWFLKMIDGKRVVEHGGSLDGFYGTIERHVDDGVTFVVLTNYERANLRALLDLLEAEFLPPAERRQD